MKTKWDIHFNQCMNGARIAESEGDPAAAAQLIRYAIHAAEHVSENRTQARRIAQREMDEIIERHFGSYKGNQIDRMIWGAHSQKELAWLKTYSDRAHG